jgi:hypothetical protein
MRKQLTEANELTTRQKIFQLDLEPLKVKLQSLGDGPGWTLAKCDTVELLYKNFLFLCFKYPEAKLVPTPDIDDFWHAHILDTRKYMDDCQEIFGRFLHHFPYLGMRDEADKKALVQAAESTASIYRVEFGTDYYAASEATMCKGCRSCDRAIDVDDHWEERPYPIRSPIHVS